MLFMLMLAFRVINLFFMIILIFYKRKEPALLLAWLLLLIFLPPIGCVMYLLFERAPLSNKKGLFLNEYQDVRQGREGGLLFNERIHSLIHFNEIYNHSRLYEFQILKVPLTRFMFSILLSVKMKSVVNSLIYLPKRRQTE